MADFAYAPSRPTGREPVRPAPADHVPLARFRWSDRHLAPSVCAHCGARLIAADIPTASFPVSDLSCLMCGRVACELVADGWRRSITAAEFRALPHQQSRRPLKHEPTADERMVRVLGHGQPMPARELAEALGVAVESLRALSQRARAAGYDVRCEDRAYHLEATR